jgi:hypothetical protein
VVISQKEGIMQYTDLNPQISFSIATAIVGSTFFFKLESGTTNYNVKTTYELNEIS